MTNKTVRVFTIFGTFDWLAAALSVAQIEREAGQDVDVYDLTHLSWPYLGTHTLIQPRIKKQRDIAFSLAEKDLKTIENALMGEAIALVRSHPDKALVKAVARFKKRYLLRSMGVLKRLVIDADVIYVPNGRFALVKLIESLVSPTTELRYFEIPLEADQRFMVLPFPFHDRVRRQEAILAASFDMTTVLKTADVWLSRRIVPNSNYNEFSAGWSNFLEDGHIAYRNVFFTSSRDEYWALGGSWLNPNWASQYQAFGAIISRLKSLGESSFLLRLHPNLLNKSLDFIRSELKEIHELKRLHPQLTIIWPHESVNSYSLVEAAERVFVSMSTIGLEASLMGKSVWLTGPSGYDEVADVRKLHSPEEVQSSLLAPWEVCKENAAKYIGTDQLLYEPIRSDITNSIQELRFWNRARRAGIIFIVIRLWARFSRFLVVTYLRLWVRGKN